MGSTLVGMSSGEWRDRIERYLVPVESQEDHADLSRTSEHEPEAAAAETEQPMARDVDHPAPEPDGNDRVAAEPHLLFISSPGGYSLVEREGPRPSIGHSVELPEQAVSFVVTKLGSSPLPNDPRICAYLQPAE
jgi:hypothetical protein